MREYKGHIVRCECCNEMFDTGVVFVSEDFVVIKKEHYELLVKQVEGIEKLRSRMEALEKK